MGGAIYNAGMGEPTSVRWLALACLAVSHRVLAGRRRLIQRVLHRRFFRWILGAIVRRLSRYIIFVLSLPSIEDYQEVSLTGSNS